MSRLELLLAGIGTAAGFSWPAYTLFAALFNLVGINLLNILFGSVFSFSFLLIGAGVLYVKHQHYKEKEANFTQTFSEYMPKTARNLASFFENIQNGFAQQADKSAGLFQYLVASLHMSGQSEKQMQRLRLLESFFYWLQTDPNKWLNLTLAEDKEKFLLQHLYMFFERRCDNEQYYRLPTFNRNSIAFISFFSAFGAIAGCSCGFAGFLVSFGLFAGLAAAPAITAAIIFTAIIIGIYVASEAVRLASNEGRNDKILDELHQVNKAIKKNGGAKKMEVMPTPQVSANIQQSLNQQPHVAPINIENEQQEDQEFSNSTVQPIA